MAGLRALARRLVPWGAPRAHAAVSDGYQRLAPAAVESTGSALRDAWRDGGIPAKQRALVDRELAAFRRGEPVPVFDALVDILRAGAQLRAGDSILEIGCSSGYYAEVLEIAGLRAVYQGCDYSEEFVRLARRLQPAHRFDVEDAARLRYADESFDVAVSGGCILHIPEYERAIAETARVGRKFAVFHRTPVLHRHETVAYTKKAYGVPTLEIHFNEQMLVRLFDRYGLRIKDVTTLSIAWDAALGDALAMKTYLCEKRGRAA